MTSIDNISSNTDINLDEFINGYRSNYVQPEEKGFQTTGNIGSILNANTNSLLNFTNGIFLNPLNQTKYNFNSINNIESNGDWVLPIIEQPPTPQLYCEKNKLSELLPRYPNGVNNLLLSPDCNLKINDSVSPTIYGISLMGVNNENLLSNPNNNIGHEINAYGYANNNGIRALGQGKNSCEILTPGHNVPNLSLEANDNGSYTATPVPINPTLPLYQVGNWTSNEHFPNNFINEYRNNVGKGCN